jgi:hypothetical protein
MDITSNSQMDITSNSQMDPGSSSNLGSSDLTYNICVECGKETKSSSIGRSMDRLDSDQGFCDHACVIACHNNVSVSSSDDVEKCFRCAKYSVKDDLVVCCKCDQNICLRCTWETNYKFYCEKCVSVCEYCQSNTYYYKNAQYACVVCGSILCQDCISPDAKCEYCI